MIKQVILDILDYLRYQVANDRCTAAELQSIYKSAMENLDIEATTQDVADFYGKNRNAVCNIPKRHFVRPPKRRVYYKFTDFIKHIPKAWRREITAEKE